MSQIKELLPGDQVRLIQSLDYDERHFDSFETFIVISTDPAQYRIMKGFGRALRLTIPVRPIKGDRIYHLPIDNLESIC